MVGCCANPQRAHVGLSVRLFVTSFSATTYNKGDTNRFLAITA